MGEIFTKKIADGEKQIFVGDFLQITKKKNYSHGKLNFLIMQNLKKFFHKKMAK